MFVFPEALFFSPPAFYFLPPSLSPSAGSSRGSRLWGTWRGDIASAVKLLKRGRIYVSRRHLGESESRAEQVLLRLKKTWWGRKRFTQTSYTLKKKINATCTLSSRCIWTIPSNNSSSGTFHVLAQGGMLKPAVVAQTARRRSWTLRLGPLLLVSKPHLECKPSVGGHGWSSMQNTVWCNAVQQAINKYQLCGFHFLFIPFCLSVSEVCCLLLRSASPQGLHHFIWEGNVLKLAC